MVADVLEFAQIVRGDDRGQPALRHRIGKHALDKLPHHGVKPVKGLVTE